MKTKFASFMIVLTMTMPAAAQNADAQNAGEQPNEGSHRWTYQSEKSDTKKYTQPGYGASIPLEVEQLRNRTASVEERAERLELALKKAIEVINAQTASIQALSAK